MKITVEQNDLGTLLKYFIPGSEVQPWMKSISNDADKGIRKQKTFKTMLSKEKRKLLKIIIEDLLTNLEIYNELKVQSLDNKYSVDLIKSKVFQKIEKTLDEYQLKSFDMTYDIAKSFIFDTKHIDEIYSIKNKYYLDSNADVLVSIIGGFRYGKTTFLKKFFGFGEDFIFPLVDKGRTSLSNCFFRGMLVKDNNITFIKDGKEIEVISADKYSYKNEIKLYNFDDFYKLTIVPSLKNSFEVYFRLKVKNEETDCLGKKVLEKFIENDKAKLDEVFGDVINYLDGEKNDFYDKIFEIFEETLEEILNEEEEYDLSDEILVIPRFNSNFENDKNISDFVDGYLYNKVKNIINEIENYTKNKLEYNKKENTVKFSLTRDQISSIDDYYTYFASNVAKYRGNLFRLLVAEIYTEIDLDIDRFSSDTNFNKIICNNITSIICTDTVGAGHKSSQNGTIIGSNDIINNLPLLNESNLIILLDDASQSMQGVTLAQIKSLVDFGLKNKILLTYSWYDYFLKNDMKNDEERVNILYSILHDKLTECFAANPNIASKLYSELTGGLSEKTNDMEDKNRVLFLKGLVPYIEKEPSAIKKSRVKRTSISKHTSEESSLAELLNKGFSEEACLNDIFSRICFFNSNLKKLNTKVYNFETNIDDSSVMNKFFNNYNNFNKEFIEQEYREYKVNIPSFKTTEALCYKLKNGENGFSGVSRELYPYNDAIAIIMKYTTFFMENIFEVRITINENGDQKDEALSKDFISDKIKNTFSKKVSEFLYIIIIKSNKNEWTTFYLDSGSGVQIRRANNIYYTLESSVKIKEGFKDTDISFIIYNIFRESVIEVINQYNNV